MTIIILFIVSLIQCSISYLLLNDLIHQYFCYCIVKVKEARFYILLPVYGGQLVNICNCFVIFFPLQFFMN
jgi:hypothetical protein